MTDEKRTKLQNRSIHKYCATLSDTLSDAGLDMKAVLRPEAEIPWTPANVKDNIWRTVQVAMFNVESTADLTTAQVSQVYEVVNRHLTNTVGVSVPFPNKDG